MSATETLTKDEVLEIIRSSLADILEREPSEISPGHAFIEDLGADSLALIELVESLEEELKDRKFDFRVEDEDLPGLRTVRDAVDYVCARLPSN